MQPFFACVAGPAANTFSQAHNYFSGEEISKQVIAVNDTENAADVIFTVSLDMPGADAPKVTTLHVPQGGIVKQPVAFAAPRIREKTRGVLRLEYVDPAGGERQDTFAVTVFPRMPVATDEPRVADTARRPWLVPAWAGRVGVIASTAGDSLTEKMRLPCRTVSVEDGIPDDLDLLIVERHALKGDATSGALTGFIEAGGQALILEQTAESLLGWRLRERRLESVFIADRQHPVVTGLDDDDLAYFRGPARIVPAEKEPSRFYRHTQSAALETPRLTNDGLVASFVFEKPCYGDFHPILVCGYDLEETALIEMRSGSGRAVFCQVDVADRYGVDPAATLLVDNMIRWLIASPPRTRRPSTAYLGGGKGKAFLDRLGIAHTDPAGGDGGAQVLTIGDGVQPGSVLPVSRGTVIVLPFSQWLPPGLSAEPVRVQQSDYPHYWNTTWYQFVMLKSLRPAPDRLGLDAADAFRGLVDNDAYFFESPELSSYQVATQAVPTEAAVAWQSRHATMVQARGGDIRYVLCSVDPYQLQHGECRRKAWRIWSQVFANANVGNTFKLSLAPTPLDISGGEWLFLTDPDGNGEKAGYPEGRFGDREPSRIRIGTIWEEQGVTDPNPNMESAPDSAYDGFAWYFRKTTLPASLADTSVYLEVGGVRDIWTFNRTANRTDLWINGKKAPPPIGIYNAQQGGRAGRLWQVPPNMLTSGSENLIAIRVYNDKGAGGIHRAPVRFEVAGQNEGMLFPYEFVKSKYTPYFFWCW